MGLGGGFVPTNMDLANIVSMMDVDFEKFNFWSLSRSHISQISKFQGRASSILLQYFICYQYHGVGQGVNVASES